MRHLPACLLLVLLASSGCTEVRVRVDTRVSPDPDLRRLLERGRYVIRGPDETAEASLAFQEFADILARALKMEGHGLKRVRPGDPADLNLTMIVNIADLGTATTSYPVYGHSYAYGYGPYGIRRYHAYGVVGTEVQTYHLGYDRTLFVSAWVPAEGAPAGRRVAWEGFAGSVGDGGDLQDAMPYLALALASHFGESTGGPVRITFSRDDDRVELLVGGLIPVERPAIEPSTRDD